MQKHFVKSNLNARQTKSRLSSLVSRSRFKQIEQIGKVCPCTQYKYELCRKVLEAR